MKGSIKLSFAVALALSGMDAMALGLGQIRVKSALNEPLSAEIPVLSSTSGELDGLKVDLASAEDFSRVGLSRDRVSQPLEFTVTTNSHGDTVIKVTTKAAVREPFLDFLLQLNWSKGKLLREYTVLLDPPVIAPISKDGVATTLPMKEQGASEIKALSETKSEKKGKDKKSSTEDLTAPVTSESKASRSTKSAPPDTKSKANVEASSKKTANEYGPVAQGETLMQIARATRPDASVNLDQMMLALWKNNPQAFFKDNINALKRGAILRIPSEEEINFTAGSTKEASATVKAQHELWVANSAVNKSAVVTETKPSTMVSASPKRDSAKPESSASSAIKAGERLALVPPAKENSKGEDKPSVSSSGSATKSSESAEVKAELARTKETLVAREQETEELKSRVKQLEDIKNKNDQLLNLKNAELAELQQRLKQLEETSKKNNNAVASTPSESPVVTTTKVSDGTAEPLSSPSSSSSVKQEEAMPAPATGDPAASSPTTREDTTASVKPELPTPAVASSPQPTASTASPSSSNTSFNDEPWYLSPLTLYGGGGGLLVVGLLALFKFMRRSTSQKVEKASHQPTPTIASGNNENEEQTLVSHVEREPENLSHHLALLGYYYVQRDAEKFEAAAEHMYEYVKDPEQVEWQQAKALGEEMAPHSLLFAADEFQEPLQSVVSSPPVSSTMDVSLTENGEEYAEQSEIMARKGTSLQSEHLSEAFSSTVPTSPIEDSADFEFHTSSSDIDLKPAADEFDLHVENTLSVTQALVDNSFAMPEPKTKEDFSFSLDVPDISSTGSSVSSVPNNAASAATPMNTPGISAEEEFFAGQDVIGTKLDLAKAYMDMGDPDGARSMLEEVLNEGSEGQKSEARKLMADIR